MPVLNVRRQGLALAMISLATSCVAQETYVEVPLSGRYPDLAPFSIMRSEVTIGEYEACVADGACDAWMAPGPGAMSAAPSQYDEARLGSAETRYDPPGEGGSATAEFEEGLASGMRASLPITFVSADQARQFCTWQGGRLPDRLERQDMIAAFADGQEGRYRDLMLAGDEAALCEDLNLPHHDARVLIEQFGSRAPMARVEDKVVRLCRTGPSLAIASAERPVNLLGSVHEWTLRQADGRLVFAAGGSWLNGAFVFEGGFDTRVDDTAQRAIDVGFRCVKPY
ncbi:Formylglycine-generating sulfatase enzyme [Jannaschia aquimarina]|uniref:Formylglycine-generating sulfatase enzyme n=2 Tax=Jannaschia aquimarina TaxID=935700 RepID=A0A0D1EH45_9RHOB|nr:Formylglycine-generating sulfatase enzyme [Jannaschia aquimarina]SNT43226.1 Formylglycine-generating enzyme, required for sulfatase activity, contains SUMF1/FGE domain [Jannaschia aquimarina]